MEHGKAVSHQEDTDKPQSMYRQDSDCKVPGLVCCCLQFSYASLEPDSARSLTAEPESKGVQSSGPQQRAASVAVSSAISAPVSPLPDHVHHQHDEGSDGGDVGGLRGDRTTSMDKGSADGSLGRAERDGATRSPHQRKRCGEGDQQVQDSSRSSSLDGQKGPRVGEESDHRRPQEDPVRSGNEAGDPGDNDSMGFGKYAHMTYGEVYAQHSSYRQWCIQTMGEEDDCHWRLKRFASWARNVSTSEANNISFRVQSQARERTVRDDTEFRMGGDRDELHGASKESVMS